MVRQFHQSVWASIVIVGASVAASVFGFDSPDKAQSSGESAREVQNTVVVSALDPSAFPFQETPPQPAPDTPMMTQPFADSGWSDWYFQAEALFLRSSNGMTNQPVVFQTFINGDPDLLRLSTGDLSFQTGYGQRYTFGRMLEENSAVEMVYFGIIDFQAARTVTTGLNDLKLPSDLGDSLTTNDFNGADEMTVTDCSHLNMGEINWIQTVCGCSPWNGTSILAGFRYVSFNERFNIHAVDFTDQGGSDYRIKTTNNLFGAQLGGRVARRYCRWGWDATGKAGLFGNAARQRQFVYDDNNTVSIRPDAPDVGGTVGASRGTVAFVGDINTSLVFQVNNTWAVRGGYNLIWIEGLALAGNQLDFTNTTDSGRGINTSNGGLFIHGASVGVEARW